MATRENDSKAGRLSKRINFLKRVTKGCTGNIMHAMDMVAAEFPAHDTNPAIADSVSAVRLKIYAKAVMIQEYADFISNLYEELKVLDPEYQPKHKPKKRKAKGT